MPGDASFSKAGRLKKPREFKAVFSQRPVRFQTENVRVLGLLRASTESKSPARLGIAIPKRLFGRAVDRNRLKRLIRESFRCSIHPPAQWDFVVQLRHADMAAIEAALPADLEGLWSRFSQRAVKNLSLH